MILSREAIQTVELLHRIPGGEDLPFHTFLKGFLDIPSCGFPESGKYFLNTVREIQGMSEIEIGRALFTQKRARSSQFDIFPALFFPVSLHKIC